MKKTSVVFFLLFFCIFNKASAQTQQLTFAFRITEVKLEKNNVFRIRIEHGTELQLKEGAEGEVWGIERKDVANHIANLGLAKLIEAGNNYSIAECSADSKIFVGDLIYLDASFPAIAYRSPYHYVSKYAIEFVDENGKPFHSFDDIVHRDGHTLQTEKFLQMQNFIKGVGESLIAQHDKRVVKAGPDAGKFVSEVIATTDTLAIWNYLYYKFMSYMTTMGQTYAVATDYTSYVEEGDVILPDLLWDKVVGTTEDGLDGLYKQYQRRITSAQLTEWIEKVREVAKEENYEGAMAQMQKLIKIIDLTKNETVKADALNLRAALHYVTSDHQNAIADYLSAEQIFMKLPENAPKGNALYYLAECYAQIRQYDLAIEKYKQCISVRERLLAKTPGDAGLLNDLYFATSSLAELLSSLKSYSEAETYFAKALELANRRVNITSQAICLWNLGYVNGDGLDQREKAIGYYDKAIELYFQLSDTASVVDLYRNKGLLFNRRQEYAAAIKIGDDGLALAESWGKDKQIAIMLNYLATVYENSKDFRQAVAYNLKLEKSYLAQNDPAKANDTKKTLAKLYKELKQFDLALKQHQERLSLVKDDPSAKADALWETAYILSENFKDDKGALKLYEECVLIYLELKDTANLNIMYANIGYEHRVMGDSIKSYQAHGKGIALSKKSSDKTLLAYALEKAAASYAHFGRHTTEVKYYSQAFEIYKSLNDYGKAALMSDYCGEGYAALKNFEPGLKWHKLAIDYYHLANDKAKEAGSYWDYAYMLGTSLDRREQAIAFYLLAYDLYMQVSDSVNASVMISNVGQSYWGLYNYEKAIEYHRKAIDLALKSKNMQQVANSWSKLAQLYSESNNPVASFEALRNSVAALETVNDSLQLATSYNDIANSYVKAKNYKDGFESFQKAIAIRKAKKDKSGWGISVYDMAYAYHIKGDYKNAGKYYTEALDIKRSLKEREGEIYCLSNMGSIEQAVNANYSKALEYLQQAVAVSKELNDENNLAFCYGRLKGLYRAQGKTVLADEYNKLALALYEKNKRWKDVASIYVDIGYDAHSVSGDVKKAMQYFDKAQTIIDTLNDNNIQAFIYSSRSSVYRETGEFDKAIDMAEKSLKLHQDVESNWGIAGTYIDLGNIYKQTSDYQLAIHHQNMADSLYRSMGLDYARLAPLANLGENYTAQGDYKKGLEYYQQSLAIMERAGDMNENLAIIKACVGESHFYLNDFTQADKWLKESLQICDKVGAMRAKADNLAVLARLKLEEKKYDEALKYINEGLTLSKSSGMTVSYLGNLLLLAKANVDQKQFAKAKPSIEECITLSKSIGKRSTLWEALYLMGLYHKNGGDLKSSRELLKESVAVIEQIRNKVSGGDEARKLFSSDKNILKVYDALIDVLLQLGDTEEAMTYLQKNNEDNLKAKFKSLDVKFENEDRKRAIDEEKVMKAKLDGLEEQISREKVLATDKQNVQKLKSLEEVKTIAESEYLKFINQQINIQPELSRYFNNSVQPTQFRKIKKQIPKDMALLSYLVGENQLYIFAATTDTVVAKIVSISGESIGKDVNAVLNITKNQLGNFGQLDLKSEEAERSELVNNVLQKDQYLKPFEELYHYLITPVYKEIVGKKRLAIIPTGSLNYIPFQLLGKTTASGKFSLLANQFSIFYTSSTDMLFRLMQDEDKEMSILAFGNPDKSLPSTEAEVQDIKKLFPDATVFIRDEATEDKAKFAGAQFNVMHFATHGSLDYEDFSKSFLTMASNPGKSEDGRLTLEELWGMDVMSHLNIVVLSACQTAVTKGSHESSPVSPASGFLQNGVKSVVATLWKVDDHATSVLVSEFYKNLKSMEAIDALRNAQIKLSQNPKYSHPYFWAGIVLLGDWR
jgi:CHAT domain-containing protein